MNAVSRDFHFDMTGLRLGLLLAWVLCLSAPNSEAAYFSEIDLGGPAGRAVEVSQLDPASPYTLVIIDANPYRASSFGLVQGVIHLEPGLGTNTVAMVSETAWPDNTVQTHPLDSLATPPDASGIDLNFARLLVLMQGDSAVQRFDRPMSDDVNADRYEPEAVIDWLVLGDADTAGRYQSNDHDIDAINAAFGIDLLARIADKDAGRIIGRSYIPDQPLDMDRLYVGDPDVRGQFDQDYFRYTYTPGLANPSLKPVFPIPEPTAAFLFAAAAVVLTGRGRSAGLPRHDCLSRDARL